jgi:hypothetical protein
MYELINPGSRDDEVDDPLASFVTIEYFITADQEPV